MRLAAVVLFLASGAIGGEDGCGEVSRRTVVKVHSCNPAEDGDGVPVLRCVGGKEGSMSGFDPFLVWDEFRVEDQEKWRKGYPGHPHRGFQEVRYILEGSFHAIDSCGGDVIVNKGGVMWMNAGGGIVHELRLFQPDVQSSLQWGFQLWVNLPHEEKDSIPYTVGFRNEQIPNVRSNGAYVKVLSGAFGGAEGPLTNHSAMDLTFLDVTVPDGKVFEYETDLTSLLVHPVSGEVVIGGVAVPRGSFAQLTPEAGVVAFGGPTRAILLAADPTREKVFAWGGFAMASREDLDKAVQDLREGRISRC
eukprot:Sspe_Gene.14894::Locus_5169_Transcript_1_1_Confidence_1.000_Length_985::g.14894::m.14894/K06911/K06911; uncharacterized protein